MVKDEDGAPIIFQGPNANFSEAGLVDLTNSDAVAFVGQDCGKHSTWVAGAGMADYAEWMPVDGAVLANGEDPRESAQSLSSLVARTQRANHQRGRPSR